MASFKRLIKIKRAYIISFQSLRRCSSHNEYRHPLITRYASKRMRSIWSEQQKFTTWRKLWVALAKSQYELGLKGISKQQIDSLEANVSNIDFKYAEAEEKRLRHDVMSHVHCYGHQCPTADGIIHLGATSCYVQDNGDLVQMKEAGNVLESKLLKLIASLRRVCLEYADLPCLGYTHFQAAQLTTVGKRLGLYLQDLYMGFKSVVDLSGQTYSRKIDYNVLCTLSMIAQSTHKMCSDIRLLQSLKEMEEPFEVSQIGSSAMAYKRNPMRSERVCSLSRYLMGLPSMC